MRKLILEYCVILKTQNYQTNFRETRCRSAIPPLFGSSAGGHNASNGRIKQRQARPHVLRLLRVRTREPEVARALPRLRFLE